MSLDIDFGKIIVQTGNLNFVSSYLLRITHDARVARRTSDDKTIMKFRRSRTCVKFSSVSSCALALLPSKYSVKPLYYDDGKSALQFPFRLSPDC